MKIILRKKKNEQSFKPKDAIYPFNEKCTMQLLGETKEKMKGFSFSFFFWNDFKMRRKHNPMLMPFLFQMTMQSNANKERDLTSIKN